MARIIEVTDLILREAQQSLLETSMALEDILPVCEDLDNAGYWSLECWGGASFDSCIRLLNEDPWEQLRTYRKLLPKTKLQMLLRGQNLLAYRNFDDSIVGRFVEKAAANGIDVFRVYDAFNDVRNLKASLEAVRKIGKHAQGSICYAPSPVYTITAYVDMAQRIKEMGCDSICIRDVAGSLKPQAGYDLVKGIKQKCGKDTLVNVHTHSTTGVTMVSLMKAVEAGCDMVDTAISSLAFGRGHNPTESFVEMLEGTGYECRLNMERILRVKQHIATVRPRYRAFFDGHVGVETEIFESQIPASMISSTEYQLKGQDTGHLLQDVLSEIRNVRRDAGYPALDPPVDQIIGTQAVFNQLHGRYTALTSEFADLMLGYYGTPLGEKNAEVLRMASARANKPPIRGRAADLLQPEWERRRSEAAALPGFGGTDEDVLTYAMFPKIAPQFFKTRMEGPKHIGNEPATKNLEQPDANRSSGTLASPVTYVVSLNGKEHKVTVAPAK
ncbi:MAG TPA: pyruvate carboxylase subunit B [Terriglobales bacterium]